MPSRGLLKKIGAIEIEENHELSGWLFLRFGRLRNLSFSCHALKLLAAINHEGSAPLVAAVKNLGVGFSGAWRSNFPAAALRVPLSSARCRRGASLEEPAPCLAGALAGPAVITPCSGFTGSLSEVRPIWRSYRV
jgi:hypothetical protein